MTSSRLSRWRRVTASVAAGLVVAAATSPAATAGQVPVLRFPFPRDDGTLTPYTFELGYSLVTLVYDTLLWRDDKGVAQPWLATGVEQSGDGRRVTAHLASGVRWHDNAPFTSDDVAFTFDHLTERPHPRFTPQVAAIERVETPDPTTAVFVLRQPAPGFSDQPLADVPILPAHLWRSLPPDRLAPEGLPVGTGPYRLVEHVAGQRYRFEANQEYFRGPPSVRTLEVTFDDNADSTLNDLQRNRVDMVPAGIPESEVARFERLGTRVERGPSYLGTVLMFNVRRPPFDQVATRQAVAAALDLDRIVAVVGNALPAERGYLHPDSRWASTERLHRFDRGPIAPAAGLGANRPLEVLAPESDPVKREAGRQVALALRRKGLRAEVNVMPAAELGKAVGQNGSEPSFDLAVWTSPPLASYDPDYLRLVFGSDEATATINYSGYRSAAFDRLAARVATSLDPDARRSAVQEALRLLATDLPVVPLFFSDGVYAFRPGAFDRWVFVAGTGILDKQSFLANAKDEAPAAPIGGRTGENESSPLALIALGLVGVAGAIAVGILLSRRR